MKCGNCHGEHDTVAETASCYRGDGNQARPRLHRPAPRQRRHPSTQPPQPEEVRPIDSTVCPQCETDEYLHGERDEQFIKITCVQCGDSFHRSPKVVCPTCGQTGAVGESHEWRPVGGGKYAWKRIYEARCSNNHSWTPTDS